MKPKRETLRHQEAFQFYYSLGSSRSYKSVAAKFKVSETAVAGWSLAFSWLRRIEERDREVAEKVAKRNMRDLVAMQERHLKLMQTVQGSYLKNLQSSNPSAGEMIKAVEYESKLLGFDPEAHGATAKEIQEMTQLLIYLLSTKIPDACPHCRRGLTFKADLAQELMTLERKYSEQAGPALALPAPEEPSDSSAPTEPAGGAQ